jgi:TRAP-type C4-dicarboxylate transport system permease small subunit
LLDRALKAADWLSLRAVWAGGALLFAASLGGADELSGYAFAIGSAWAFAFALLRRANVRVDALYQHLPPKLCALLDILALVALGAFALFLARYAWEVMATSWSLASRSNSALKVPLWIPQALWVSGLGLFLATLALLLARALKALAGGDWTWIRATLGARSVVDEAEEETAYARALERKPR